MKSERITSASLWAWGFAMFCPVFKQLWAFAVGQPESHRPVLIERASESLVSATWDIDTMQTMLSIRVPDTSMTLPVACLFSEASAHTSISTGKERDTESGNDYFGARYYASSMGRFLSPDWSAKVEPGPELPQIACVPKRKRSMLVVVVRQNSIRTDF